VVENSLREFAYDLNTDAYEYIGKMDEKRGFVASDKMPEFHGNMMKKSDVKKYLYELQEFEDTHTRVNYHGEFITLEDYKEELLKEQLEKSGWNIMNIYNNKEEKKKQEAQDKKDKKKEKRLRKQLSEIKDRRKARNQNKFEGVNTKKKKSKKKSKKKADSFGNVVAKANGASDFDEYEQMMLDMSFNH
jgi:hypothetical protein